MKFNITRSWMYQGIGSNRAKHMNVSIEQDNIKIDLGLLSLKERKQLISELQIAIDELLFDSEKDEDIVEEIKD